MPDKPAPAQPRPTSEKHQPAALLSPYGNEPPDYEQYTYGYPPSSGQMLGSGN
jgi:hypothetical protein